MSETKSGVPWWSGGQDSVLSLAALQIQSLVWELCVLSRVWLFVTPWSVARKAPLSKGILQARILESVVIAFSKI